GPIRRDAAQRALPRVHMGVDEARQHDAIGGTDDLRAIRRRNVRRNRRDAVVLDQHVADRKVRDARLHRDHGAALDENPTHALPPPVPRRLVRQPWWLAERYDIHVSPARRTYMITDFDVALGDPAAARAPRAPRLPPAPPHAGAIRLSRRE